MSAYRLVRVGFDTIIASFRATLPIELREALKAARSKAREKRSDEPLMLGPGNVSGVVLCHGVQGGYDAIFSTGELGEMWQFKTDQKGDRFPLRMKIRAGALLAHGYPNAVDIALKRLEKFGIHIEEMRLSEVHVCFDIIAGAEFQLHETQLIRPGKSIIRPYDVIDKKHPLAAGDEPTEVERFLRGTKVQSLTVGSPKTGSQSIIYDKGAEAALKRNCLIFEAYGLDRTNPDWSLWRTEFRFRGPVLKQRFKVRSFADLEQKIAVMLDWATTRLRYVAEGQGRIHPTRRIPHPIWQTIRGAISRFSAAQPSMILPSVAQYILDREKENALESAIVGASIARLAMDGSDVASIDERLSTRVTEIIEQKRRDDPHKIIESIERAISRREGTARTMPLTPNKRA